MPRTSVVQTNFTAGELSPRALGRTDIDRYNSAAKLLFNAHPVIHGGAKRRAGTRYFKAAKIAAKTARLIPFIYSRDLAYMVEVGDSYLRVHGAGGVDLGVELATSWTESMLPDVDFAQSADTMFLAHPTVAMQRLRRISAASFALAPAPLTVTPFAEQGHRPAADLTLSDATVGVGRTATTSANSFLETDVGRRLIAGLGVATVTAVASATSATIDISTEFASASLSSGEWLLDLSPQGFIRPFGEKPQGSSISVLGAKTRAATLSLSALTGAITVTASAAVFTAGDVGKRIVSGLGVANITAYTDPTHVDANTSGDFTESELLEGSYGMSADVWRPEDVGSYVRLNDGLLRIVAVGPAANAIATIEKSLSSQIAVPPLAWSLESAEWTGPNGYPRTVTFHEQRLVAGGTTRKPQTLWGSKTGEYLDFTKGTDDTDAYSFTIAADELNPIGYLAAMRNLVAHTYGGEFSVQGGVEKPVTPTNVRVRPESAHGSRGVRPVTVGNESVFVQRAGRKVRTLGYRVEADAYTSPDLTVLAEHITAGGVQGLCYQQEPDYLLWGWRGDGAFISSTYDREQSVNGWAQHATEGWVESMATIPNGDREETWLIVRRTVNGATVRYVEIMDDTWLPMLPGATYTGLPPAPESTVYGYTVDCGVHFDNVAGQTTFSVPHLVGCTVDIVADGAVMPQQVVPASGSITISRASYRTLIGLHFKSRIGLLTPEIGTGTGTAQGNSMRTSEITVRFLNTIGASVFDGDGDKVGDLSFRSFGPDVLDQAPEPFTGTKRIEKLGWERGRDEIEIVQDQPLPMHVLSVVRKYTVND